MCKNWEDFRGFVKSFILLCDVLLSKKKKAQPYTLTLYLQLPIETMRKRSVLENKGVSGESSKGRDCFHTNLNVLGISLL